MHGVKHKSHEELTLLELVLQLHGEFRRSLAPIGVTPLQAGVLLYVRRQTGTNMTNAAAALCVRMPTLSEVVQDLVRKRWVTKRRALHDDRALCLRLSRQGEVLVQKITERIRDIRSNLMFEKET